MNVESRQSPRMSLVPRLFGFGVHFSMRSLLDGMRDLVRIGCGSLVTQRSVCVVVLLPSAAGFLSVPHLVSTETACNQP